MGIKPIFFSLIFCSLMMVSPKIYGAEVSSAYAGRALDTLNENEQGGRSDYCATACGGATNSCYESCMPKGEIYNYSSETQCQDQLSQLMSSCTSTATEAQNSCDDSQNTGLAQAQQAAVALGQQVSTSVQAACSGMGKISQAANAATAAYQMNCQNSVDSCKAACAAAIDFYQKNDGCVVGPPRPGQTTSVPSSLTDTQKSCSSLQAKSDQAKQALQNFLVTTAQAQNCASLTSGTGLVTPEICKANPNLVGCTAAGTVDCTKPEMASNKVCVCAKTPNDPSCIGSKSSGGDASGSASLASVTSKSAADSLNGDMYGLPGIDQAKADPSLAGAAVDGKQGGGANLGGDSGGSGGGGGRGGGAGGAGADPTAVNAGFYGGGGSGGGFGGSSNGRGGGSGAGAAMAAKGANGLPNLRQFLPGGAFDPKGRGLAGASGPDGITGPHSDIWQKIQNRYQVIGPTLMP